MLPPSIQLNPLRAIGVLQRTTRLRPRATRVGRSKVIRPSTIPRTRICRRRRRRRCIACINSLIPSTTRNLSGWRHERRRRRSSGRTNSRITRHTCSSISRRRPIAARSAGSSSGSRIVRSCRVRTKARAIDSSP